MKKIIAVLVCLLVAVAFSGGQDRQKTLNSKLGNIKKKAENLRSQIRQNSNQQNQVVDEMRWVDDQISKLDDRLDASRERLDTAKSTQKRLASELAKESEQLATVKVEAGLRLKAMAMRGSETVLSVLVGAKSVGDFASRKALVERVAQHDKQLFQSVRVLRDQVLAKKQAQDGVVAKIAKITHSIQGDMNEMKAAQSKKKKLLAQLESTKDKLEEQLDEMESQSRTIESQLRAYQAKSGSKAYVGGKFMKPANGPITSGFGNRYHPIVHKNRLHAGIDIGAGSGSPIVAAAAGTVVSAGWRGGYGNCVIIDHGGNISTLYGHMSRISVSDGQKVARGQKIGNVGSTGLATGPHLHWEVRVNGTPVNPSGRF